jgi:CelD/BcsL family acetyltransferase involved in cellulose biosynthesis
MSGWRRKTIFIIDLPYLILMGLEIRQIDSHVELESLQKDWDRILRTSGEDDVFLKLEWLRPCWETFGKGKSLVLLEVSEGDRVVAFAPLMISKKGKPIPLRWLEFIGSGPSDRCGVIAEGGRKDVHSALWKHVMRDRRWNAINLRDMKDEGPTTKNLKDSFIGGEYTYGTAPYLS